MPRFRREADRLLTAAQLLTRLPVAPSQFRPEELARAARYFPLVGFGVGALAAAILLAAAQLWPPPIPALLALAASVLATGALHEDGLADTADGSGARDRAHRLAIMADSRLGTYGALALGIALALQVAALSALDPATAAAALLCAGAGGRFAAILVMASQPYAGTGAKVVHGEGRPGAIEIGLGAATAAAPLLLLPPGRALAALGLGLVVAAIPGWRACRALGGYTGDVLGAVTALFATGFLVGAAVRMG